MISNKGFKCIKNFHNYIQFSRTFSVATRPLFFKSQPYQPRENNFRKKNDYADDHRFKNRNNYAGSFKKTNYADTFGTLDEDASRMFEYREDPDDIKELQRQRDVTYKPWNQHMRDIRCHLGRHDYKKAVEVLEVDILKNERRRPPHHVFDMLLTYCGRCGDLKEAYRIYLMLKNRQYPITGGNYTSFFNAAALCSKRELALERIRKVTEDLMTSTFHQPNVTNYNAMVKAYARHGDMEMCLKIVDAVLAERGSAPIDLYNHLLQACVTDKNAGFRHAIAIWHKMLSKKKTKPDRYTFNLLLRCVRECSLGPVELIDTFIKEILSYNKEEKKKFVGRETTDLPEEVELIEDKKSEELGGSELNELEEVKPSEVKVGSKQVFSSNLPNLLLRNPVIGSIVKLNRISTPQDRFLLMGGLPGFFQLLSDFKVKPDHKMLAQVLDVIPDNLEAEEDYIKLLKEKEIKIQTDFVNVLLKRRIFRREKKEHIKDSLKLLQQYSLTPDIFTYGTFALSCDTLEEAEDFLKLLQDAGVSLNTPMWNALLAGALRNTDLKYAKAMIKAGKEADVQPDSISLRYLKRIVQNSGGNVSRRYFQDGTEYIEEDEFKERENSNSESQFGELKSEIDKVNDFESNQKSTLDSTVRYREDVGYDGYNKVGNRRNNSKTATKRLERDPVEEIQSLGLEFSHEEVKAAFSKVNDHEDMRSELGKVDNLEADEKSNLDERLGTDTENIEAIAVEENEKLVAEYLNVREKMKSVKIDNLESENSILEEESKPKTKRGRKKTENVG